MASTSVIFTRAPSIRLTVIVNYTPIVYNRQPGGHLARPLLDRPLRARQARGPARAAAVEQHERLVAPLRPDRLDPGLRRRADGRRDRRRPRRRAGGADRRAPARPRDAAGRRHGPADRRPVRLAGCLARVHAALAERRQLQPLVPGRPGRRRPTSSSRTSSRPSCFRSRTSSSTCTRGGRSGLCPPWSEMHWVDDPVQRRAMVDAMLAWGTDHHFVYIDIAGTGLLVGEAERQGKVVVSTELGGGGHVTAATHRIAQSGLANVLRHVGVLRGEVDDPRRPRDHRPGDRRRELPARAGERPLGDVRRPRRARGRGPARRPDPLPRAPRSRAGRRHAPETTGSSSSSARSRRPTRATTSP